MKRREFLLGAVKAVAVLGTGNALASYPAEAFRWPGASDVKLRFAVVSDGHFGQEGTAFKQFHEEMIHWLNSENENHALAFVIVNGDVIHDDATLLPQVKDQFSRLKVPFYASRGNHDRCSPAEWKRTWGHELNYSFVRQECAFIVFDTSDEKGSLLCPDLNWARTELERHSSAKAIFAFMHVPPHKWTENGVACRKLTRLLSRQPNVKAMFHGHDHNLDGVYTRGTKHYFFDGHLGGNWGVEYRGYRIVEVMNDHSVITYQVDPTRLRQVNRTLLD